MARILMDTGTQMFYPVLHLGPEIGSHHNPAESAPEPAQPGWSDIPAGWCRHFMRGQLALAGMGFLVMSLFGIAMFSFLPALRI